MYVYKTAYLSASEPAFEAAFKHLAAWPINQKPMAQDPTGTGSAMLRFLAEMVEHEERLKVRFYFQL